MPESTETSTPSATAGSNSTSDGTDDGSPSRRRGLLNQKQLLELELAESFVRKARTPGYAAVFAAGGIDEPFLTQFETDIGAARGAVATATQKTTGRRSATGSEARKQADLVSLLQEVQKRARQKHAAKNKVALKDYFIGDGQKLDANRARLEQCAASILAKLADDPLPGITAAHQGAIAAAIAAYKQADTEQSAQQADATGARAALAEKVNDIASRRREIQFAADAQWPHENPANAGPRSEFKLPANKAFKA